LLEGRNRPTKRRRLASCLLRVELRGAEGSEDVSLAVTGSRPAVLGFSTQALQVRARWRGARYVGFLDDALNDAFFDGALLLFVDLYLLSDFDACGLPRRPVP
jgi:hypothetical protein